MVRTIALCITLIFLPIWVCSATHSQSDTLLVPTKQDLGEITVTSQRLSFQLKESSQTVQLIPRSVIEQSGAFLATDLLQQVPGLDIQRRGVGYTQADLNIRGGTFDQSLLLIDGVRLDDAQTGHHTLNFLPPLSVIDRIEITKGPSARIFGQNAFTGGVHIITKEEVDRPVSLSVGTGSFGHRSAQVVAGASTSRHSVYTVASYQQSDGYRSNTDFTHSSLLLRATLNKTKNPYSILVFFSARDFGANGFYATPSATEQYEETESSLIAVSRQVIIDRWILTPKVYWRRGEDLYQYIRNRPDIYENLHVTHKTGGSLDASYSGKWGDTGMGIDFSEIRIESTNLGDRSRNMMTLYVEQRIQLLKEKIDITPGFAAAYFTDFNWHFYPGVDLGVRLHERLKLYANLGQTYRIPTYTDLYYSDRTTLGNEALRPESALAHELGLRFSTDTFWVTLAYFSRTSKNLIDYVKNRSEELFQAQNIQRIQTQGIETEAFIRLSKKRETPQLRIGYTTLQNQFQEIAYAISRYSINNDLKHQFLVHYAQPFSEFLSSSVSYKFARRSSGRQYSIVDLSARWKTRNVTFSAHLHNLLNTSYWETNLIPMPGRNGGFGIEVTL